MLTFLIPTLNYSTVCEFVYDGFPNNIELPLPSLIIQVSKFSYLQTSEWVRDE